MLYIRVFALSLAGCFASAHAHNTLTATFATGRDDLRGGNDNLNLILLRRDGTAERLDYINGGKRWPDNQTQTVRRSIRSAPEEIAAVRLETTFSGGIAGDNWNLDRLVIRVANESGGRTLVDLAGQPLFRFTGDQRVRDFRVTGAGSLIPAPAVRSRFDPRIHGFQFVNSFLNVFISELNWTTRGLCGGMSYAALDYFHAGRPVPSQNYMPAEGTTLQSYLYNRQVHSIERNVDKWAEYSFNPFGWRNAEFFRWGLQMGSGRLGELQRRLDRGQPVPLGLKSCGNDCGCPGGCPGDHQVLAIGYQFGRYSGNPDSFAGDVSIFVYDPNYPGRTMTLKPEPSRAMYQYAEGTGKRWRAYFVDMKYTPASPPEIATLPAEVTMEFTTGGDDLRGGNDNVHAILLLRSGREIRFDNVNGGRRWIDNSRQTVARSLPAAVRPEDIAGIRLETTFGGGIAGDNWNLDCLQLTVRVGSNSRLLLRRDGRPLVRFTGARRTAEFRI